MRPIIGALLLVLAAASLSARVGSTITARGISGCICIRLNCAFDKGATKPCV
jgi:hypothetical protein